MLAAATIVFVSVAFYVFGLHYFDWAESDAAVSAVLAHKLLVAKSPIVRTWYYANGDVWTIGSQLLSLVPVALFGVGRTSLWLTVVGGFALELYGFGKVYRRLGSHSWAAMFAAMVTLMAWSNHHVEFEYSQLAYGLLTLLCMITFTLFATLAEESLERRGRFALVGALLAAVAVQNPARALAFVLAPVLAACAWPWRGLPRRRRLLLIVVALSGWLLAFIVYSRVLARLVAFSVPRGHLDFVFVDASGIATNLDRLARGLAMMCGGGEEPSLRALPGIFVLTGSLVLVARELLASRALTALRFVTVAVVAQLGIVLVPLVFGNLLVDIPSTRYVMPSLVEVIGLGALLAARAIDESGWVRKLAIGWLVTVPITAALAMPHAQPPPAQRYVWPDTGELDAIAHAVVERGLTRGYSDVLSANLLTLDTGGAAMVCPVWFSEFVVPHRWLTDTACFRAATLPDRFFVVTYQDDRDRGPLRATMPSAIETFHVGPTYEVSVYRSADTPLSWLNLPLPENDRGAFPLHIPATHLQLRRGKVAVEGERLVATGETGTVVYGPYITLPRGRYTVTWSGNGLPSAGEIKFFILTHGTEKLAEASFLAQQLPAERGPLVKLTFKLQAPMDAMEFSVYSQDGGRVALDDLLIERR